MKGLRHVAVAHTVAALASPVPSVFTAPLCITEIINAPAVSTDRPLAFQSLAPETHVVSVAA